MKAISIVGRANGQLYAPLMSWNDKLWVLF